MVLLQTGILGAVCVLDDEPIGCGKHCGQVEASLCQSRKISVSIAALIQPESGPVCLFGTEYQKKICWEFLVAGSEQGIEAGQVGLRLITKSDRQSTVTKEWSISATSIADGRFVSIVLSTRLSSFFLLLLLCFIWHESVLMQGFCYVFCELD